MGRKKKNKDYNGFDDYNSGYFNGKCKYCGASMSRLNHLNSSYSTSYWCNECQSSVDVYDDGYGNFEQLWEEGDVSIYSYVEQNRYLNALRNEELEERNEKVSVQACCRCGNVESKEWYTVDISKDGQFTMFSTKLYLCEDCKKDFFNER